jgi:hypothetical protein
VFPRRRVVWALSSTVILCRGGAGLREGGVLEKEPPRTAPRGHGVVRLFRLLGYA